MGGGVRVKIEGSLNLEIGPLVVDLDPSYPQMIVRRNQEEVSGPPQHCTNRIYVSHDSPDDSGAIAQL